MNLFEDDDHERRISMTRGGAGSLPGGATSKIAALDKTVTPDEDAHASETGVLGLGGLDDLEVLAPAAGTGSTMSKMSHLSLTSGGLVLHLDDVHLLQHLMIALSEHTLAPLQDVEGLTFLEVLDQLSVCQCSLVSAIACVRTLAAM